MRLRWSVAAIAVCLCSAWADDDVQALMQKAQSGQKLSPEELQQIRQYYFNQAQQLRNGAGTPAMSDEAWKLMDKKKRGEQLTPEEQQQLRDEMMKGGLSKVPAANANTNASKAAAAFASAEGATPKENASLHLDVRPVLDQAGYLKLVKQLQTEASAAIDPDRSSKLLVQAKGRAANNLGVMMTFAPDGPPASALLLCAAAIAEPNRAQVASNLAVAVYQANFFERSWDLLSWADHLKPQSADITGNRAWAALYLGDFKTAERLFNLVLQYDSHQADAHTGLALLAKARGNLTLMASQARAATEGGAGGFVDQVLQGEGNTGKTEDQRADSTPMVDESGYASMGGVVYDNTAGAGFTFPIWNVPTEPEHALMMVPAYGEALVKEQATLKRLSEQRQQKDLAYAQAQAARATGLTATGVSFPRRNPRILVMLDDLQHIYDARIARVERQWEKAAVEAPKAAVTVQAKLGQEFGAKGLACGNDDPCHKRVEYEYCERRHAEGRKIHGAAGEAYGKSMKQVRDLMTELWRKSDPLVNGIADPQLQELRELDRRVMLYKWLTAGRVMVAPWVANVGPMAAGVCVSPPPEPDPALVAAAKKDPDTPDPKPGKCFPPPGSQGIGPVNVSWDCGGFKIEGGEGLFAGVQVKFAGADHKGTLSGHTETTVFAGVGDELAIGKASGKAAATISFTQAQGQVVDVGAKYETSASAEGFGAKASAGTELDWSMRSGPDLKWSSQGSFSDRSLWNISN